MQQTHDPIAEKLSKTMTLRTLYFDESGFTGYNLLDDTQPYFSIASTDIDQHKAEEILRTCFPHYRASEFKFTNIWRSNNRNGLEQFSHNIGQLRNHVVVWTVNKRFAVLTKMVDFLIEPYMTDAGYDFYSDGFCWKYVNAIHFALTRSDPEQLYHSLLRDYQTFSRNPSKQSLRNLQFNLRIKAKSVDKELRIILDQMALGAELFANYMNVDTFRDSNELQVTCMLAVVIQWRKRYLDDFVAVHDASSNFFRRQDMWEKMTNKDVPEQIFSLGDGTTVMFPLRVISTSSEDSKKNYSIQFCDILAGLSARRLHPNMTNDERKFLDSLKEAGLGDIGRDGIHSDLTFPDTFPPRRLTGPDVVDQMTDVIFGPHNL